MKSLKTGQYKRAWPLQEHLVKTLLFSFYLKKKKKLRNIVKPGGKKSSIQNYGGKNITVHVSSFIIK